MDNELLQILTNLGLNKKEATVYLACIETGTAPVSQIAQAGKINRVTAYDILEKLKQKGLVSYFTKKKIRYFTGVSPEIMLTEYEKRTADLKSILPKLKSLTGETSHPRVKYFEGLEGIKTIYSDTLTSKTEILNYSNSAEIRKVWPDYDKDYVEKRSEKGIFLRGICPKDRAGEIVQSQDKKYFRELRLLPANQFNFTNEINIYDNKVSIISFKNELIGMIIESNEIANSQRAIFNMCWQFTGVIDHIDIKTKLLKPLTGDDLERASRQITSDTKAQVALEGKNLSLF